MSKQFSWDIRQYIMELDHQIIDHQIHQSPEPIIGSNTTLADRLDEINILVSEAITTVYEIEKTPAPQLTYVTNTTSEQNATQIMEDMEDINMFKYYVEGISLTTIGIIGILGKQYIS